MPVSELNLDWIHPRIGLDLIRMGQIIVILFLNVIIRWGLRAGLVR